MDQACNTCPVNTGPVATRCPIKKKLNQQMGLRKKRGLPKKVPNLS